MVSRALVLLTAAALLRGSENKSHQDSVGGWSPTITDYPWAVGVYKADRDKKPVFNNVCGGSLVGVDVVLSSAHCFWNGGNRIQLDEYRITAGNDYRDIEYSEDKQICQVVGWGFTDNNKPSEQRVAVQLPYIDFDTCWKTVPQEFQPFVTRDKFCAGHRNGTAVCPGDSGGGLAFFHPTSQTWYLRGIVSVGVTPKGEDNCFKTQYSAFTSIASNYLWLKKHLNEARHPVENVPIVFPPKNDK